MKSNHLKQDFSNCGILQSRIGEHGESMENMEKMEDINHMSKNTLYVIQNTPFMTQNSLYTFPGANRANIDPGPRFNFAIAAFQGKS